jgi:hypothetical protein
MKILSGGRTLLSLKFHKSRRVQLKYRHEDCRNKFNKREKGQGKLRILLFDDMSLPLCVIRMLTD